MSLCNITRTCPQCAYIGFIEGNYPWIECPECNVENKVKYCTQCNEIYHPKQTCEEAKIEQQRLKDPKHRAEEAMSQATKRHCPYCNQEYQKGNGCNKITCRCGKLSCYLCGQKIKDYSHFGDSPGKCKLWTSTQAMEQLDRTKRQEAGRKVLAEAGITDEAQIEAILASPPRKLLQKKKAVQPARRLAAAGAAVPARVVHIPRNNNVARLPAGGVGSPPVRQQRNMRLVARRRREQRDPRLPEGPLFQPEVPVEAAVAEREVRLPEGQPHQPVNRRNLDFVFVLMLFLGMIIIRYNHVLWNESNNEF